MEETLTRSLEDHLTHIRGLLEELETDNPGEDTIKRAEWRGRMTAVVERLVTSQDALGAKVDNLIWKVAGIAATVSLLVALVMQLLP